MHVSPDDGRLPRVHLPDHQDLVEAAGAAHVLRAHDGAVVVGAHAAAAVVVVPEEAAAVEAVSLVVAPAEGRGQGAAAEVGEAAGEGAAAAAEDAVEVGGQVSEPEGQVEIFPTGNLESKIEK